MHAYATDANRDKILIIIAVLAIAVTFGVNALLQKLMIQIPWWLESPSVMFFYGFFYVLFDQVLWRMQFGPIEFCKIPNVGGVWAGTLTSSYENGTKISIVFYIKQTWSKMVIRTETATSTSSTTMAALNTEDSRDPGLQYEYMSEPGALATPTMQIHRGTGHLQISSDRRTLTGDYYTGRGRHTYGSLELHFVSKKRLSREEALKCLTPQEVSSSS